MRPELTSPSPITEQESTMSVQLALVQDQLRELTTKLEAPKAASVNQSGTQYPLTQSPRRVTFWDDGSHFDRQREYGRYDTPRRSDSGGRFRGDWPLYVAEAAVEEVADYEDGGELPWSRSPIGWDV